MTADLRADLLVEDRAARRAAQTRFDVPLVLQAGAGTGKTTTLIGRLLAWTLGEGWERAARRLSERSTGRPRDEGPDRVAAEALGRVVAITFTEAAAAEMAGRAARELASLASGAEAPDWLEASLLPPNPERARRARALLGTLDHLAVRTIHAFCRGLLADHPLAARVHRLIAPRFRKGVRAPNATKIADALGVLLGRLEDAAAPVETLTGWFADLLPENLVDHLKKWRRRIEGNEASLFGEVADELGVAAALLVQLLDQLGRFDPELMEHGRRALIPLLGRIERELRSRGIATFDFLL